MVVISEELSMSQAAYRKACKFERVPSIQRGRTAGPGCGGPWRHRIRHPLAAFRRTRRERPQPREDGGIFTGGNDIAVGEPSRNRTGLHKDDVDAVERTMGEKRN